MMLKNKSILEVIWEILKHEKSDKNLPNDIERHLMAQNGKTSQFSNLGYYLIEIQINVPSLIFSSFRLTSQKE